MNREDLIRKYISEGMTQQQAELAADAEMSAMESTPSYEAMFSNPSLTLSMLGMPNSNTAINSTSLPAYVEEQRREGVPLEIATQTWTQANTSNPNNTREAYVTEQVANGVSRQRANQNWDEMNPIGVLKPLPATLDPFTPSTPGLIPTEQPSTNKDNINLFGNIPLFYPGGTSMEYEAYKLGQGIGAGGTGGGLLAGASAGALALGGARQVLSGVSNAKQTQRSYDYYVQQMQRNNYVPQMQYMNQNNRSGVTVNKYGGTLKFKKK